MKNPFSALAVLPLVCVTPARSAQCLSIQNCPATAMTVCDHSSNDGYFWKGPYWYDPVTRLHDLSEVALPLSVQFIDTCSAGAATVSFVLWLDLDGDGQQETAVANSLLILANTIFFGNAANPAYVGSTPYHFDERLVPETQQ